MAHNGRLEEVLNPVECAQRGLILPEELPEQVTEPEPGLTRQVLVHTPALMLVRHRMRRDWVGTAHSHPHEQLVYVVSGRLRVTVGGITSEYSCGDSFIVASNVEHQAMALEESLVLDVFSPAREDYV